MVRIEAPQQDRLQHAPHHGGQMGTPHAARTIRVLAAHDRVAQRAFRGIVIHGHFWALHKDCQPLPMVVETGEDLGLGKVKVLFLKMALTAGLHLAQVALQLAVAALVDSAISPSG